MRKNLSVIILIIALLFVVMQGVSLFAEEKDTSTSVLTLGAKTQNVYGAVGKIDYVDFKARGESTLVLKTSKGESIEVSLKELKSEKVAAKSKLKKGIREK